MHVTTQPEVIDNFDAEYAFLSNFHEYAFHTPPLTTLQERLFPGGLYWKTAEHAFQAAKCVRERDHDQVRVAPTPGKAKRAGRAVQLRPDWEEIKDEMMLRILRIKFAAGTELAARLLSTGNATLVEGNAWGDTYWGTNLNGRGQNRLGQLLMQVRQELRDYTEREAPALYRDLLLLIQRAASNPGQYTPRHPLHQEWDGGTAYELTPAWVARAVLTAVTAEYTVLPGDIRDLGLSLAEGPRLELYCPQALTSVQCQWHHDTGIDPIEGDPVRLGDVLTAAVDHTGPAAAEAHRHPRNRATQ